MVDIRLPVVKWAFVRPLCPPPLEEWADTSVEDWVEARLAHGLDRAGFHTAQEALRHMDGIPQAALAALGLRAALRETSGMRAEDTRSIPPPMAAQAARLLDAWVEDPAATTLTRQLRAAGLDLGPEVSPMEAWAHVPFADRILWAAALCQAAGVLMSCDAVTVHESMLAVPERWHRGWREESLRARGTPPRHHDAGWTARPAPGALVAPAVLDALWRHRDADLAWWNHHLSRVPSVARLVGAHAARLPLTDPRRSLALWCQALPDVAPPPSSERQPAAAPPPDSVSPAPPFDEEARRALPPGWGFTPSRPNAAAPDKPRARRHDAPRAG